MKTALVIGASGQDGSYMVDHLLTLGYRVIATVRNEFAQQFVSKQAEVVQLDLEDRATALWFILKEYAPDEIYNLAGQTYQQNGWAAPSYTLEVNTAFVAHLLEAMKTFTPNARLFQPSAAGMFGKTTGPCNEETPFRPQTPYDVSKYASHQLCEIYRKMGLFISVGILFSHESPRRGREMVSRKISMAVAHWALNKEYPLTLGGVDFKKDWGHAPQFVEAMHAMLQLDTPGDYVLGTGATYSIRDFIDFALMSCMLSTDWLSNMHIDATTTRKYVFEGYADTTKAQKDLGWNNTKVSFMQLVTSMVENDIQLLSKK